VVFLVLMFRVRLPRIRAGVSRLCNSCGTLVYAYNTGSPLVEILLCYCACLYSSLYPGVAKAWPSLNYFPPALGWTTAAHSTRAGMDSPTQFSGASFSRTDQEDEFHIHEELSYISNASAKRSRNYIARLVILL
jgi:hypothetical protein